MLSRRSRQADPSQDDGDRAQASGLEIARCGDAQPGSPRLRPMASSDLAEVLRIEEASFPTPWSERTFRNLMRRANARLWVAESQVGELLGYAVAWFAGSKAELGDLAVSPEARRSGVGRALVEALLEDARNHGVQLVFLEVRESNAAARRLYEEVGFEAVGRRPGYYARPVEDALVMRIATGSEAR